MLLYHEQELLEWLSLFRLATTQQLCTLFYNGDYKICARRLLKLSNDSLLKKEKNTIGMGNVYSTQRIRSMLQARHSFIRNDLYIKLIGMGAIIDNITVERVFGSIRPDMTCRCMYRGLSLTLFIEVETNSNKHDVNVNKYNEWMLGEWKEFLNVKPMVLFVTDKPVIGAKFNYKAIPTSLNGVENIFK